MKIGLQTWGSDGDIRPFIALASGLSAKGHDVTLVITNPERKDYSYYGKTLNFKIKHAHNSYRDWDKHESLITKNKNLVKLLICLFEDLFEVAVDEIYEAAQQLCNQNDIVIGHFFVHHGGAGTTYAVSLAGCPSIIVHHLPDQIFWGAQLKKLGIAPNSLNIKSITSRKLSKEIRKVLNSDEMKNRAQEVGKSMQKEDGVERAVELIEKSCKKKQCLDSGYLILQGVR